MMVDCSTNEKRIDELLGMVNSLASAVKYIQDSNSKSDFMVGHLTTAMKEISQAILILQMDIRYIKKKLNIEDGAEVTVH